MKSISIVDYGVGNLLSVARAIEYNGSNFKIAKSAEDIQRADRILLPGVGAFPDGMKELRTRGLIEPLIEKAKSGSPFLGICLGMQMLMETSEEFGQHEGLSLIPGSVVEIPPTTIDGSSLKIPHIGWRTLERLSNQPLIPWEKTCLRGLDRSNSVYFVHSYAVVTKSPEHRLAECEYGGFRFAAAVCKENIVGFQFHPEKSGDAGLSILKEFLELT